MESIKLKSISITNIKNIAYGHIDFTYDQTYLNTLGIYGQNGSGKTTLIQCLDIIAHIISGNLKDFDIKMLDESNEAVIAIEIEQVGLKTIRYEVTFKRSDDGFIIVKEALYNIIGDSLDNILTFDLYSAEIVKSKYPLNLSLDVLKIIKNLSLKDKSSFLFNDNFIDTIKEIDVLMIYLVIMKNFAKNIKIYHNQSASLIKNNNIALPFLLKDKNTYTQHLFEKHDYIPIKYKDDYEVLVKQINLVVSVLFPHLQLSTLQRDIRIGKDGQDEVRLELIVENNGKTFSIQHESDGIKKLITIISYLIYVYNNESAIVVIDEIDAHIYEYLLGELIDLIATGAKGQLIFTSHNLRVLEKLDDKKIIFTTNQSDNRFIKIKDYNQDDNLRDIYIRSIIIDDIEQSFYSGSGQGDIRLAFTMAGLEGEQDA